jgi:hypothetical protein
LGRLSDWPALHAALLQNAVIAGMIRNSFRGGAVIVFLAFLSSAQSQTLSCSEVQGFAEVSPYEGQVVTVYGKVTEYFGDAWYIQDDFGAWNGIYCVGPNVLVDANPPWWNAPRQPEVGDVFELTGTVAEQDGNTQLVDITEYVFVDFWNATASGMSMICSDIPDEKFEGTRVRLQSVVVETEPDAEGVWTVSDVSGTATILGVDTDDLSMNEDPDGPTVGDVYSVYGALRQIGEEYVIDCGDIDTIALVVGVEERLARQLHVFPIPAADAFTVQGVEGDFQWFLTNAVGQTVQRGAGNGTAHLSVVGLKAGRYVLNVEQEGRHIRRPVLVH